MKITGKAQGQFEKWYLSDKVSYLNPHIVNFYGLPDSLQWGVIQDWADSVGYFITNSWIGDNQFCPGITHNNFILWEDTFRTRQEARKAAIEKLNEILKSLE